MFLKALQKLVSYKLLVVERPDSTSADIAALREVLPNAQIMTFRATPFVLNRLGPGGRYLESAAARLPPWVRYRYSEELNAELNESSGFGIAIGEAAGAYIEGTAVKWHWDKANVLAASTRLDRGEAHGPRYRMRGAYLEYVSRLFEGAALGGSGTVSVTSAEESRRLDSAYGRSADWVIPSCVEMPKNFLRAAAGREVVWLGSFAYESNVTGLLRFLRGGWPLLRDRGYKLKLIGSGISPSLRVQLGQFQGISILGYVADLSAVLRTAEVAVVPLWSGAGVKLKTLTLLSYGIPVFSTPVGAEGVRSSEALVLRDSPEELSLAILDQSGGDLRSMSERAVELIGEHYSASAFDSAVADSLGALLGGTV